MPAGWQRSNGELVSLLRFLLFISSLSIFCLVNLVKAEFEMRFFFVVGIYVITFGVRMAWGGACSLLRQEEWDFRHRKFAEELCDGEGCVGV